MRCIVCGKEMKNTLGGNYHCENCGHAINDLVYRPSNCDMPTPQGFGEMRGWICPVCGRGVAPWMSFCPCQIDAGASSVTTGIGSIDLSKYYTLVNDGTVPEAKL